MYIHEQTDMVLDAVHWLAGAGGLCEAVAVALGANHKAHVYSKPCPLPLLLPLYIPMVVVGGREGGMEAVNCVFNPW